MSSEGEIKHVSDTALMVAACRAHETELEDAFVRDPFAARLSGERGVAILREMPYSNMMRIGLAIRTRFLDDVLLEALNSHSITTVLSVGCGLDTRPWRLNLDKKLRWIEVDFAEVLDYKDRLMQKEAPRCRRERLNLDVSDPVQRQTMFESSGSESALLITEGLLLYLPAATVKALSAEAFKRIGLRHWITDITTGAFTRVLGGEADNIESLRHVRAPDCLEGEQIFDSIQGQGWTVSSQRSYITDAGFAQERGRRMMGGTPPPPLPFPPGDPSGVLCFARL